MRVQQEDDGSNDIVTKRGIVETATSQNFAVVEYVQDDVKLLQTPGKPICVKERGLNLALLSR